MIFQGKQLLKHPPQIFYSKSSQMDIPDLNYSSPIKPVTNENITVFYSLEGSRSQQQISDTQILSTYQDYFKIILQDQIRKKTLNISWQTRYFCLTPTRLLYYSSRNKLQIKGCFNLQSLSKQCLIFMEVRQQQLTLKLSLYFNQNVKQQFKDLILLNFQNIPKRYHLWKIYLNKIIQQLSHKTKYRYKSPIITMKQILKKQKHLTKINFWNKITISQNQFLSFVNHLDILFFKSKHSFNFLQRFIMRSEFDHVAILFKDISDSVLVLQAIESRGVWINQWNQMLPIFKQHYEELAYRKLLLDQKHKIDLQILQSYLDTVIGTKYELSLSKLFIPQQTQIVTPPIQATKPTQNLSQLSQQNQRKKSYQQNKTFFCSQLIADIYIKLGLITGKKRHQFWPRDFQGSIQLSQNAKLTPLMYISLQ